jgi:hypothetical protein
LSFATSYNEDLSGCTGQWNGTAHDTRDFTAFGAHDADGEEERGEDSRNNLTTCFKALGGDIKKFDWFGSAGEQLSTDNHVAGQRGV